MVFQDSRGELAMAYFLCPQCGVRHLALMHKEVVICKCGAMVESSLVTGYRLLSPAEREQVFEVMSFLRGRQ